MSLFTADLKCRIVQAAVMKKVYAGHKANSFEPAGERDRLALPDGIIIERNICYGNTYPNSFFDIWYPSEEEKIRPVIVYFHGGGFLFGDKSSGDPLAAEEEGGLLKDIVRAGYCLVNVNYAFAPAYRFPTQVRQVDEVMRYLMSHAGELKIDMSRICLGGGSAGADLTEIYGAAVCNAAYAAALGLEPAATPDNLKALVIDEAALDTRTFDFDKNMYAMLHCWLGDGSRKYGKKAQLLNAKEHITDKYIPAWINSSNQESWFVSEAHDLAAKLADKGCEHELVYFEPSTDTLQHGYMNFKDTNVCAKKAFESMMKFMGEHV